MFYVEGNAYNTFVFRPEELQQAKGSYGREKTGKLCLYVS